MGREWRSGNKKAKKNKENKRIDILCPFAYAIIIENQEYIQYIQNYKGAFCFVEYEDVENGKPKSFPPDNERNRTARRQQQ